MKKTLTVNLGGTVFQIDEDAYILLDNYLNNLRFHFRKEEGGEEIVHDMEMRISELFAESMEGGQQVITIDNVEAVIERMGRPEQLDDEAGESSYGSQEGEKGQYASSGSQHTSAHEQQSSAKEAGQAASGYAGGKVKKRLFRDVDNRVLGGVLSGIAAYFGWDPTALRLVFILLGFLPSGPSLLLIYLMLLFIIPPARTATEKLQMRGEPINMENIGKTVTGGFEREKNAATSKEQRTGVQKFFDAIVAIVGVIIKVFMAFLLIVMIPVLFIGFISLFALLMSVFGIFIHVPSVCWSLMPSIPWDNLMIVPGRGVFFLLSIILTAGIPLVAIIQIVLQNYGYAKPMSSWAKLGMVLVWFISLIVGFILFFTISTL